MRSEWDGRFADQEQLWSVGPTVRWWPRSPFSRLGGCLMSVAARAPMPSGWPAVVGAVAGLEVSGVALDRAAGHARAMPASPGVPGGRGLRLPMSA